MTTNSLSRRQLIRNGFKLATTLGAAAGFGHLGKMSAFAQTTGSDYKALVCVFLFGGNDSNNMVIPMSGQPAAQYTALRANLAIKNPLELGSSAFGFHPNMTALANLYGKGNVAVNFNVGTLVAPLTRTPVSYTHLTLPTNREV